MRNRERAVTLFEVALAMILFALGGLLVTEALRSSEGAARADHAKSRSIRDGDTFLRRMGLELTQTTTRVDPSLPAAESQRFWLVANGVRFQKVVGHILGPDGSVAQEWSPEITYTWDEDAGEVRRSEGGASAQVIARRVSEFSVGTSAAGQVVVQIETRAGSENRGEEAAHRQVIRVTPRNDLR